MPKYVKFLKELISNKRKIEELSTITLNKEWLDQGIFTLPCEIGEVSIKKTLADLGASINLILYSVFKELGLCDAKHPHMSIQLVDHSMKYLRGKIKDILVKVGKFIFQVDFMILDMEEDLEIILILGCPF